MRRFVVPILISLGTLIRFALALQGIHGTDILYHIAGAHTVLKGGLLYRDVFYTYPPLYAYLQAFSIAVLGDNLIAYKFWPIVSDILISILIYRYLSKSSRGVALLATALYLYNPLAILSSSWYGLFDSLMSLLILLAIILYIDGRLHLSSTMLGLGTVTKVTSAIVAPLAAIHSYVEKDLKSSIKLLILFLIPIILIEVPYILATGGVAVEQQLQFHVERLGEGFSAAILLSKYIGDVYTSLALWIIRIGLYIGIAFTMVRSSTRNPVDVEKQRRVVLASFLNALMVFISFNTFLYPHYILHFLPLYIIVYSDDIHRAFLSILKSREIDISWIPQTLYLAIASFLCPLYWRYYRDFNTVESIALIYTASVIPIVVKLFRQNV